MTTYKIIVNPISGRGAGEKSIPLIEQSLRGYDLDFDFVCTERPWHAAELTQQACAEGYDSGGCHRNVLAFPGLVSKQFAPGHGWKGI